MSDDKHDQVDDGGSEGYMTKKDVDGSYNSDNALQSMSSEDGNLHFASSNQR